ncbi:MAG: TnpV protein [Lachnospiraceae bacterium]|nr:TnpV protein [Lachnospiraceae bacterium]
MGKVDIPYVEKDGILYPLLTIPADMELSAVGKYGLLWLTYIKENHKGRFRTLTRLGCVNRTAHKVNEEAYEMLDVMISQHMRKHLPVNLGSTIEMWKLREQAKTVAEETVLMDIVYQYH